MRSPAVTLGALPGGAVCVRVAGTDVAQRRRAPERGLARLRAWLS